MKLKNLLWINLTFLLIILFSIWYNQLTYIENANFYFKHHLYSDKRLKNDYELLQLTRLINSESGSENFIDKLYVGSVVLNWMRKNKTSIDDVIYYPNKFSGVYGSGFRYSDESRKAAEILLKYGPIDTTVYYFINPKIAADLHWKHTVMKRELVFKNDNHYFYR